MSGKTKDALGLLLREVPDALTVIEFVEVRIHMSNKEQIYEEVE